MYSAKNPSWQQLTINEADVLDQDVMMPRLDQQELFAPRAEDVQMLEREVNLYRSKMQDEELMAMQNERSRLVNLLNQQDNDDLDDQLNEVNRRIEARRA